MLVHETIWIRIWPFYSNKTFKCYSNILTHTWYNMTEKEGFACDFPGCDKVYPKQWRLREHQCSAHTGEVKKFVANFLLTTKTHFPFSGHLSADTKDAPNPMSGVLILSDTYKWATVRKSLSSVFKLKIMFIYKYRMRLRCSKADCDAAFSVAYNLKRHERTHELPCPYHVNHNNIQYSSVHTIRMILRVLLAISLSVL